MGALDALSTESETLSLKVSWIKAKIQRFIALFDGNIDLPPPAAVQGERVSYVDNFVYLGSGVPLTTMFGGVNTCAEEQ